MKNGMDLEATLMRRGLPFDVNAQTHLATDWFQVGQRVSQSENGLARWEVVGASLDLVEQAKRAIAACVAKMAGLRAGNPPVLVADASHARRELGWEPRYTAITPIIETAWRWHQSHPHGYDEGART